MEQKTDMDPAFQTYDLTLTDRELEDFLSFMEHQNTGCYADNAPQLPEVAADFPGLQLQPHTDSPSNSEGSESIGVEPPVVQMQHLMGSTASFSTAQPGGLASLNGSNSTWGDALLPEEQLPASSFMDASATLPRLEAMEIKVEPGAGSDMANGVRSPSVPMPAAAGTSSMPVQAPTGACTAGPSSSDAPAAAAAVVASPNSSANGTTVSLPYTAAVQQPVSLGMTSMLAPSGLNLPMALGSWTGTPATPASVAAGQQPMPQMLFIQGPAAPAAACSQQQQQQQGSLLRSASAAAAATIAQPEPVLHRTASKLHRSASNADTSSSGGKLQISHSTVEKQRRDRLNSLIDELSDIVPPADPKYGNDATSVRRPKHVVLADTINLLKAMQAKLQIEEAEICTLKQQAAAVAAMAAAQQQQQGMVAAAATSNGVSVGSPAPDGLACAGPAGELGGGGLPCLPQVPDGLGPSTGVLVEQGVNCLFVKVNCRDRKGLLSDVVSALKAFPSLVISTAAITTTKDGTVHDVFEVKIEDESVTAEDIQCAVHMALFAAERLRSKRLRQDSGIAAQDDM